MDIPTAHALLRDRRHWLGTCTGLVVDGDGALLLARVPAPVDGQAPTGATPLPAARDASGIAAGPCGAVFVADTAHHQILFVDGLCNARSVIPATSTPSSLPGHFDTPRGLALAADALLVADSGNDRVQRLALPRLEAHWALAATGAPCGVAVDSRGRTLIVDVSGLQRRAPDGSEDLAFAQAVGSALVQPRFIAIGPGDTLLVSDIATNQVLRFDADGQSLDPLAGPAGWLPGALACDGPRCYVADAADASVRVFDDGMPIGHIPGWQGPVSALAVDAEHALLVKPDLGPRWYRLPADAAFVASGTLAAGPLDAGESRAWERALVQADIPPDTTLTIEVALQAAAQPAPTAWLPLPSPDALLELLVPDASERRCLWWRLNVGSTLPAASPRLHQVRAATAAEDYLDHLPLTYRRHDDSGFLSRWLRLLRGEFAGVEEQLDDMPRVADASFAPVSSLPWLAQWLALELPRIADDAQRRALIAQAVALYARRGTKASIAGFVELHTGIRPAIVEAFTERAVWVLGRSSRLGFDTRLPAHDPLGLVVPDSAAQPCPPGAIGRAVVGASGPLASYQLGLPLWADTAYRFCVVVDAYRAADPSTLAELRRIVDREKPAHTDYRVRLVTPELRVGLQSVVGIDTIVGGDPSPWRLAPAALGVTTRLPPADVSRVGSASVDTLTLL